MIDIGSSIVSAALDSALPVLRTAWIPSGSTVLHAISAAYIRTWPHIELARHSGEASRLGPTSVGPLLLLPASGTVCKRLLMHKPQTGPVAVGRWMATSGPLPLINFAPSDDHSWMVLPGRRLDCLLVCYGLSDAPHGWHSWMTDMPLFCHHLPICISGLRWPFWL